MRKLIAVSSAVLATIAITSTPATAGKSAQAGTSRGKVYLSLSNDKTNSSLCSYKITGSNLAPNHTLWADTSYNADDSDIRALAVTEASGSVTSNFEPLSRSEWNRRLQVIMFTDGYSSILDIYGQPAAISISNNCAP